MCCEVSPLMVREKSLHGHINIVFSTIFYLKNSARLCLQSHSFIQSFHTVIHLNTPPLPPKKTWQSLRIIDKKDMFICLIIRFNSLSSFFLVRFQQHKDHWQKLIFDRLPSLFWQVVKGTNCLKGNLHSYQRITIKALCLITKGQPRHVTIIQDGGAQEIWKQKYAILKFVFLHYRHSPDKKL